MKIIIDIQDEKYNLIKSELYNTLPAEVKEWGAEAIRNGTIILNCDDCKTPCIMYEKGAGCEQKGDKK